ncbi:MAG: MFS transporter [Rhodospirillales bacterium]|nr:MAG: MFS transporter [Rhodospirillales bacterium]
MTPAAALPGTRVYATAVASMLAVQILCSLATQSIPVMAPVAAPALGVPKEWVGYFTALTYCTAILSAAAGGLLATRYGTIRVSQASLVLCGGALALFGGGSIWLLAPAALVMGMGVGPPTPSSSQVLARVTPARFANITFSVKQTGVPLGNALAGVLAPALIALWEWRSASLAMCAMCVALAVLLQPLRATFDSTREGDGSLYAAISGLFGPVGRVWRAPDLRRLALASFVFTASQVGFGAFLVVYLVERIGLSLASAGLTLSIGLVSGAAGRIFWGLVADRSRRPVATLAVMTIGMVAGALAFAFSAPGWPWAAMVAAAVVFGSTAAGWGGVFFAEIARRAGPGQVGALTGGAQFFTFSGALLVPPAFSVLLASTGSYMALFAALAAMNLVAGLSLLPLARVEKA